MNKVLLSIAPLSIALTSPAIAQIVPDQSVGSTITTGQTIRGVVSDRIDGGTIVGPNLFHSFREFNVTAGRGAYFANPAGITHIFSRVTGSNASTIDGTLGVLGNANLVLLNPNGVLFGKAARLDLNGSFLGTTATQINFADGTTFSATEDATQARSLLTNTIPIGLGFGSHTGAIQVQGTGHPIATLEPTFAPLFPVGLPSGLIVKPGKTLALVGGDVTFTGGSLTASQGRVEVGSVGSGTVAIDPQFALNYANVSEFRDITLQNRSLLDVSGTGAGSIHLAGDRIRISDGSLIWSQNRGLSLKPGGDLTIKANDLEIIGTTIDEKFRTGVYSETVGLGPSGNIKLAVGTLDLQTGGTVISRTYSPAPSGEVTVNARDRIVLDGFSPNVNLASAMGSFNYYIPTKPTDLPAITAKSGDVTIATPFLSLRDGGYLFAFALGDGPAGNVLVNANAIELVGHTPETAPLSLQSTISSVGYSKGPAGNITLNTGTLALKEGGMISSTSLGTSNAGKIAITATESVSLTDDPMPHYFITNISSTIGAGIDVQKVVKTYAAIGDAGSITIQTPTLTLDHAGITVQNLGTGKTGMIDLQADTLTLTASGILASSVSGQGGDLAIASDTLQLRNQSFILTNAGTQGNGGNMTLKAKTLIQLENSDITANAGRGNGGNIRITTQGLFRSPDSNITATSALGIDGTITIAGLNLDQQNAMSEPSSSFTNADQIVAGSCLAKRNATQGSFVVTGNGGLPESPMETLASEYHFDLMRSTSVNAIAPTQPSASVQPSAPVSSTKTAIVEATQLVKDANGRTKLIATPQVRSADRFACD